MKSPNTHIEFEFPVGYDTAQTLDVWTISARRGVSSISAESFVGNWVKAKATAKQLRYLAAELGASFKTVCELEERIADELERAQDINRVHKHLPEPFIDALDCLADIGSCDEHELETYIKPFREYTVGLDFIAGIAGRVVLWRQDGKDRVMSFQTSQGAELHYYDVCEEVKEAFEAKLAMTRPGVRQRLSGLAERMAA